jgi:ABC-type transport system substrate-binding protein
VWTIKLRRSIKFTDGTPLNSAAIVANWNRLADPATACNCLTTLTSFTSYVPVDDLTLHVTLPSPRPSFPYDVAKVASARSLMASPQALQQYGAPYGSSPETTVGAGAFML